MEAGRLGLVDGIANCASRGMRVALLGKTSHDSAPKDGVSPLGALSRLVTGMSALGPGGELDPEFALVTVPHASMGEPAFGMAPGRAELWATLRTVTDPRMVALVEALVRAEAGAENLHNETGYDKIFLTCVHDADARAVLLKAGRTGGVEFFEVETPMRWCKDFGRYGQAGAKAAMFLPVAGQDQPQLHNPDYDFPDARIGVGTDVFLGAIRALLG